MTSGEAFEGLPDDLDQEDMRLLELEAAAYLAETVFRARPVPPRPLLLEPVKRDPMREDIILAMTATVFGAGVAAGYCMTRVIDVIRGWRNG